MEASRARIVIKVIAILKIIGSIGLVLLGSLFAYLNSLAAAGILPDPNVDQAAAAPILAVLAMVFFALAVVSALIGVGLWRMRNWARIIYLTGVWLGLALSVLIIASNLAEGQDVPSILIGLVMFALSALMLYVFQFNDDIRTQFVPAVIGGTESVQPTEVMMLTADAAPAVTEQPIIASGSVNVAKRQSKLPVKKTAKAVAKSFSTSRLLSYLK